VHPRAHTNIKLITLNLILNGLYLYNIT